MNTDNNSRFKETEEKQLRFYYSYQQLMKNNFFNSTAENRLGNILSASLSKNFETSYKNYYRIASTTEMLFHQPFISVGASLASAGAAA